MWKQLLLYLRQLLMVVPEMVRQQQQQHLPMTAWMGVLR
jgi:hypothetical protein